MKTEVTEAENNALSIMFQSMGQPLALPMKVVPKRRLLPVQLVAPRLNAQWAEIEKRQKEEELERERIVFPTD